MPEFKPDCLSGKLMLAHGGSISRTQSVVLPARPPCGNPRMPFSTRGRLRGRREGTNEKAGDVVAELVEHEPLHIFGDGPACAEENKKQHKANPNPAWPGLTSYIPVGWPKALIGLASLAQTRNSRAVFLFGARWPILPQLEHVELAQGGCLCLPFSSQVLWLELLWGTPFPSCSSPGTCRGT